nr:purine/pyrimidine permease [uncultured Aminipila sp.]
MRYGLDEKMPTGECLMYGLQHLIYFLAGAAIMPVIVAAYLGLNHNQTTEMLQRTFFLCGIISIIQTRFGHRYPIVDGPAGLWMGILITLTSATTAFGGSLASLRTDLEMGMILSGGLIIIIGLTGLISRISKVFTPLVNGVFLILMVLQLSGTLMKGMTGTTKGAGEISLANVLVFLLTAGIILLINIKGKGFVKSVATLIGVAIGWCTALMLGIGEKINLTGTSLFSLPKVFAWGMPTFNGGVVITCMVGCVMLFANVIASINGMADVAQDKVIPKQLNRSIGFYGFTAVMTGIVPTVGFVPFASSMGVIAMTGVASRRPFYLGSAFMIVLGLIAPVGSFFASIPPSVGYAAMMIVFALILGQGLREFQRVEFTQRENLIVGISMLVGMGVMFLPSALFISLPGFWKYIFSNGLIVGMLMSIILEQLVLREKLIK